MLSTAPCVLWCVPIQTRNTPYHDVPDALTFVQKEVKEGKRDAA
jgi:hypothetical protein